MSLTYDRQLHCFLEPVSERVDLSFQGFDIQGPRLFGELVEYIIKGCPADKSCMVLLRPAIRQHFGEKRIRAEEVPDFCMDILGITPHSEDEKALLERIQSIHKLLEIQSHSR